MDPLFILIPYRDRESHLLTFVPHMEAILAATPHIYTVLEQEGSKPFNKGKLLNAGFTLLRDQTKCPCFHDVDMLPLDGGGHYRATSGTTHLASSVEQFGYSLPYPEYLGGVFLSPINEFESANGFSNEYWGWGGEDDDLYARFQLASIPIERKIGRYASLPHPRPGNSTANHVRLMRTLAEVIRSARDEHIKRRAEELHLNYRRSLGHDAVAPSNYQTDGLSNLRFKLIETRRLKDAFSFPCELATCHSLIRLAL